MLLLFCVENTRMCIFCLAQRMLLNFMVPAKILMNILYPLSLTHFVPFFIFPYFSLCVFKIMCWEKCDSQRPPCLSACEAGFCLGNEILYMAILV